LFHVGPNRGCENINVCTSSQWVSVTHILANTVNTNEHQDEKSQQPSISANLTGLFWQTSWPFKCKNMGLIVRK
jgi:hypothetical protein